MFVDAPTEAEFLEASVTNSSAAAQAQRYGTHVEGHAPTIMSSRATKFGPSRTIIVITVPANSRIIAGILLAAYRFFL
jgi:hypothetical protein